MGACSAATKATGLQCALIETVILISAGREDKTGPDAVVVFLKERIPTVPGDDSPGVHRYLVGNIEGGEVVIEGSSE